MIDLHIHTCFSDGEYTPEEIITMAIDKGLKTIAITDHDTVLGLKEIDFNRTDIKVIPGIELSAITEVGRLHILGYHIDPFNQQLNERLTEIQTSNIYTIMELILQLKKDFGLIIDIDDINYLITKKKNIGRPDLAAILRKQGIVSTTQEAFDRFLIPSYEKLGAHKKGIEWQECFQLIKDAGGSVSIAHPGTLKKTDQELLEFLKEMKQEGLDAIEAIYSTHTIHEQSKYLNMTEELGLSYTIGSDYHGPNIKPEIELGTGKNKNLCIKKSPVINVPLLNLK